MNPEQIQRLNERRQGLYRQMQEVLDLADGENRGLSAEESQRYDALERDFDAATADLQRAERMQERAAAVAAPQREAVARALPGGDRVIEPPPAGGPSEDEYREAFGAYLRSIPRQGIDLTPEQRRVLNSGFEQRALGTTSGAVGGFTVPPAFYDALLVARKTFGGMRSGPTTKITTEAGQDLPIPTADDTANVGAILAENTQVPQQDVAFGSKTLKSHTYTSKLILVPYQLLQDSAFDLEGFLSARLGERIGRIENTHFTTGDGVSKPRGIVADAAAGVVAAAGNTIKVDYDHLIDLQHAIDPIYRPQAAYMFHDSTLKIIRKMKDSQGRPLWSPGILGQLGATPDTILEHAYVVNNDMPVMAASAKSILFGDLSRYWIRDVKGVTLIRLDERYADFLQVGFMAFSRTDGALIDVNGTVVYYQNSAT